MAAIASKASMVGTVLFFHASSTSFHNALRAAFESALQHIDTQNLSLLKAPSIPPVAAAPPLVLVHKALSSACNECLHVIWKPP